MTHDTVRSVQSPSALSALSACGSARAAIVLFVAVMVGCANKCPPFRAAWYLDDSPEAAAAAAAAVAAASAASVASAPTVLLALLNEGPKKLEVARLYVNPTEENNGSEVLLPPAVPPAKKLELRPGELWLFAVTVKDPSDICVLPVRVKVQCNDGRSQTQLVSGSLPNYLHIDWIKSCVPKWPK